MRKSQSTKKTVTMWNGIKKTTEKVYKFSEREGVWNLDHVTTFYEIGEASAIVSDFCLGGGNRLGNDAATMCPMCKGLPMQRTRSYKHVSSAHEKAIEWCIEHK